ncbi:MAG: hypothetical protein EPO28_12090 [Saprospiraceae bacterium]|nr:MAG: hypothetical protein EPO28_12090 [Saprospiraceae bacterium]
MLFKIDENLPLELAEMLQAGGHDAATVPSQNLEGKPDPLIFKVCSEEQRILVTLDKGFSDIRRYPPGTHPGFIVLRLKNQDKFSIIEIFKKVIPLLQTEHLPGNLWIVDDYQVRIRS